MARRALALAESALNLLSAAILFALMFYVTAEVTMRYVFGRPLPGHLETTQLLIAPAAVLALAWVQARRGHVGMDLFQQLLPPRARSAADCATLAIAFSTFAVLTWFTWDAARLAWEIDDVTPTAAVPTWWSKAAMPLGLGLLCVRLALQLVDSARAAWRGDER